MPDPPFDDPFQWFDAWYAEALENVSPNPDAMALATADRDGRPSSRVVLLKSWDREGFVFHTNRTSRKGRELEENPRAALTFYWRDLDHQIRIEGTAAKLSERESDEYFSTRERGSQIGAWASMQSNPMQHPSELEERVREFEERFPETVPRPPHWGGYRIKPLRFEFWEQGNFRIHTRWEFHLVPEGGWSSALLYP